MGKPEKWTEKMIRDVLSNPMYAGIGPLPNGELPTIPRLMDDDQWVKSQGRLISEFGLRNHLIAVRRSLHEALGKKVAVIAHASWLDASVAKIEEYGAEKFFIDFLAQLRPQTKALELVENQVQFINITPKLLHALASDPDEIFKLTPSVFEMLVCERLHSMGFGVQMVGKNTFHKDGGIDIVAWPKVPEFPFLMAVQVKYHHSPRKKTPPSSVNQLAGVLSAQSFHAGVLVTNTNFTPDTEWAAKQHKNLIRLRDIRAIRRWLAGDFLNEYDLCEFPEEIEVCPGVRVKLPRL